MDKRPVKILATFCILAGLVLLLEGYGYLKGVYRFWPIFPFILGTGFILLFAKRLKNDFALLGIGIYTICVSIFFLILNFIGWQALSRLWPLFIGFLGLSFLGPIAFGKKRGVFVPIASFLILLCTFFILIFTIDSRLWPISLVLFGSCLLLVNHFDKKKIITPNPKPEQND